MRWKTLLAVAALGLLVGCTGETTLTTDTGGGGEDGWTGGTSSGSGTTSGTGTGGTATTGSTSGTGTTSGSGSGGSTSGTYTPPSEFGEPSEDPNCKDEDGDGFYAGCPAGRDCHDGNAEINPDATEVCGDKVDNDCLGGRDNACECDEEGATRACYVGPAGSLGSGSCRAGEQRCSGGVWSNCTGQTLPSPETCNGEDDDCDGALDEEVSNACGTCGEITAQEMCNGEDDDCDGRVDEGCQCGPDNDCYTGPPQTRGVGACDDGRRRCSGESWGACEGSVTPVAEQCGDGIDNDCDGETDEDCNCAKQPEVCDGIDNDCDNEIDEGCTPCLQNGGAGNQEPWQIHKGQGPQCWPQKFGSHGEKGEYQYANIPPRGDSGWAIEQDQRISFDDRSTMCGTNGSPDKCECRKGGDFTYFQTFFDIPSTFTVNSLKVEIDNVDDGARITIFNRKHPNGVVLPGSYAYLGGGSTSDLAGEIVSGTNRVVITHVDDCCSVRRIAGVRVKLNGKEVTQCK